VPDSPAPKPFDPGPGLIVVGSEVTTFALAGIVFDYLFGTAPWCTIGLTVLGLIAAVLLTIRLLKKEADSKKP